MFSLLTRLNQPYPFELRWHSGVKNGLWAGGFILVFLFFFRPFGTEVAPGHEWRYLITCCGFGLVTFLITLLVNAFCLLLPRIFNEDKWTVWKEILFNLFFISWIGMGNLLLANLLWSVPFNGRTFLNWQGITFAVGIFPTFIGALLTQMKLSKQYAAEAAVLHLPQIHPSQTGMITLLGENQHEILNLNAAQIAYLAAQDNYVQVFYTEDGILKNRMLRATLRKLETSLEPWPQFQRCHRTYLVNFDLVEKVSGNAQGYRVHLTGIEESIPVSRNLNEVVRARLGGK